MKLEECLKETTADKEARKKMSKTNAKAFNTFGQKLRKHNKDWNNEIQLYLSNQASTAEEPEQALSDDESDADEPAQWKSVNRKQKKAAAPVAEKPGVVVWTDKLIDEKLEEINKQRGRKKATAKQLVGNLKTLLTNAKSPQKKVNIYMQIISCLFDITGSNMNKIMKPKLWTEVRTNIKELLDLLEADHSLTLKETDAEADGQNSYEDQVQAENLILGNMTAFIEQLDAEFNKALQNIDPHTHEYVERLRSESSFLELAAQVQDYYHKNNKVAQATRIAMKRIEHIYYKHDSLSEKMEEAHQERQDQLKRSTEAKEKVEEANTASADKKTMDMEQLCKLVYTHGDERLKTKAMLCHVYHHALHDRHSQARDLLLMSHIQDNVQHMDARTQVLYNRATVQLGLCAFRKGYISDAHSCLADICSGGKTREYLAQGISSQKYQEKNPEQERLEKLRQVPYHMHINLELLEAAHLTSAMLLEVPHMASHRFDSRPRPISRALRRLLEIFDKQIFTGPPETTRDVCVNATKALAKGNWKRCEELLLNLSAWNLIGNSDQVKAMLRRKIQEEGLRTYIFTYAPYYDAMSLDELSNMFELPRNTGTSPPFNKAKSQRKERKETAS